MATDQHEIPVALLGSLGQNDVCYWDAANSEWAVKTVSELLSSTSLSVVQVEYVYSKTLASTSTVLPVDNSVPQNTEGGEFLTKAITPTNTSNILLVEAVVRGAGSPGADYDSAAALFQDSTAGALASDTAPGKNSWAARLHVVHAMVAGTASATTFKIRAGMAPAGSWTFNGGSTMGGTVGSWLKITEVAV